MPTAGPATIQVFHEGGRNPVTGAVTTASQSLPEPEPEPGIKPEELG